MAISKEIKNRIKSVKNTKKITKAMELVAASKMKRAVAKTLGSRLYANYSWELLTSLSIKLEEETHPFFTEQKTGKTLMVLITSNRGLCGGYNTQIIKKTVSKIKELNPKTNDNNIDFIIIGKKGNNAITRIKQNIIASFIELPDIISLSDINPISQLLESEYKIGSYKDVYIAYTDFISALSQKPQIKKLLPISKDYAREIIKGVNNLENFGKEKKEIQNNLSFGTDYILEGDTNKLIESLVLKLVRMQIYQMILESSASEQSSRMISMKNAGDAAGEMIDDLTLVFNKSRQANITREISEISAGMSSVSR
jgi:F-type H+-transporting ATPase subunit gamma